MRLCIALGLLTLFLTSPAYSKARPISATEIEAMKTLEPHQRWDSPQWREDLANIASAPDQCQKAWDVLWSWAKKGNLQARSALFTYEAWRDMLFAYTPLTLSYLDSGGHLLEILAIHQLGYKDHSEADFEKSVLEGLKSRSNTQNARFIACYETNPSPACTTIAIEDGMVPTFEAFAARIDEAIDKGAKPFCRPPEPTTGVLAVTPK